jgi:hypothetical protein
MLPCRASAEFRINVLGETVISAQCKIAVSVFSIDYDVPVFVAAPFQAHLKAALGQTEVVDD